MSRVLDPGRLGEHLDRLHRVARALCGSRDHADDLVQETCVRVLSRPRVMHNDDDIAYLVTVLRNTFISQQRRARSRPALASGEELEQLADRSAPSPHQQAEARLVLDTIAALRQDFREALVAVDVVGLRYAEAARALGVRETTLTNRVFRARRRVVQALA
jgi:RNA polymerase sigma-70 factor, ECF subfamily